MKIIYRDGLKANTAIIGGCLHFRAESYGGILECNTIYFTEKEVIADDIYIVPLDEILRIESA